MILQDAAVRTAKLMRKCSERQIQVLQALSRHSFMATSMVIAAECGFSRPLDARNFLRILMGQLQLDQSSTPERAAHLSAAWVLYLSKGDELGWHGAFDIAPLTDVARSDPRVQEIAAEIVRLSPYERRVLYHWLIAQRGDEAAAASAVEISEVYRFRMLARSITSQIYGARAQGTATFAVLAQGYALWREWQTSEEADRRVAV